MLKTKKKNIIFKNKYIELQDNLVQDLESNKEFNHLRLIENNTNNPGSVVLCNYKNKFLLIRNYRYGTDELCLELPRGYNESNETLKDCAIRELYEETNIIFDKKIDKLTKLGEMSVNSSIIASKVSLYLLKINQIIENIQLQKEEHIISYKWYTLEDLHSKIKDGTIIDSFTLSTLILYEVMNKKN